MDKTTLQKPQSSSLNNAKITQYFQLDSSPRRIFFYILFHLSIRDLIYVNQEKLTTSRIRYTEFYLFYMDVMPMTALF